MNTKKQNDLEDVADYSPRLAPTPRCDAAERRQEDRSEYIGRVVPADFARTLEREVNEQKRINAMGEDLLQYGIRAVEIADNSNINLRTQLTAANQQISELREALEKIAAYTKPIGMQGGSIVNEIATKALAALTPKEGA